jgi:LPS export ABC transporter protein LptC
MINTSPNKFFWQAALFLSCLFFFSCENDPGVVNGINDRKANIEEARNIQSFLSQNGNLRAKLVAPFMLRYAMDTSYLEFPKTLHVNFYDSSGKVESELNALYGKYFETRSLVYLRDSVVVFNVKGDTLRTPDLWWDQNTKKFYTDNRVRIQRKGQRVIGGKGMEATQDLKDITIFKIESPSYITVPDSMRAN